jgi:nickel-dependent lactate racemase
VGTTSRGTPVSFDRAVLEAGGIVTINSVEPHYFAGYTGGRKSFLPGVAGFGTIERNHSHACDPGAEALRLEGNPVSEDMYEAAAFLSSKPTFTVQTVMTPDGRLHSAYAGALEPAFRRAVEAASGLFSVRVRSRASIVIAAAPPPMDIDLYQSQKALENGRLALEGRGIIILVSECRDGIGDRGFYEMLAGFKPGESVSDYMGRNYRLGNHKGARLLALREHAAEVFAVTSLGDEVLKPTGMRGFADLQAAVDEASALVKLRGGEPSLLVLPGASLTVPRVVP